MKTETLTHGLSKAVREVSAIYHLCKEWEGVILCESENSANFHFGQVIFVKKDLVIPQGKYTDKIDEHIIKYNNGRHGGQPLAPDAMLFKTKVLP